MGNKAFLFVEIAKNFKGAIAAPAITLTILTVAALLIGAACQKTEKIKTVDAEYRVVTDDLGREVRIRYKVERAVSLAPNLTEMVFAVGAGERLVGDTTYCNYPEQAKAIQKVGDTLSPNMESIIALKPDVVFVSTASQIETFTRTLEQNGIAVFVTNPNSLDDVNANLLKFGELFGTNEAASKLVEDLKGRTKKAMLHAAAGPVRVLVQIETETIFTVGRSSFITDVIERAGGKSVTDNVDAAYFPLSKETALALQPDVIVLSDSESNREPNEVFRNSPAVKNKHVLRINADLLSRPGPRSVDALEQIVDYLKSIGH